MVQQTDEWGWKLFTNVTGCKLQQIWANLASGCYSPSRLPVWPCAGLFLCTKLLKSQSAIKKTQTNFQLSMKKQLSPSSKYHRQCKGAWKLIKRQTTKKKNQQPKIPNQPTKKPTKTTHKTNKQKSSDLVLRKNSMQCECQCRGEGLCSQPLDQLRAAVHFQPKPEEKDSLLVGFFWVGCLLPCAWTAQHMVGQIAGVV